VGIIAAVKIKVPSERSLPICVGGRARGFALSKGEESMTSIGRSLLGTAVGAGLFALSSISASAAIVCSGNVCWHAHERFEYPPGAKLTVHEDDWRPGPRMTFREHEGRGYWKGDKWTEW
jgi:hypothetical protein